MSDGRDDQVDEPLPFEAYRGSVSTTDDVDVAAGARGRADEHVGAGPSVGDEAARPSAQATPSVVEPPLIQRLTQSTPDVTRRQRELDAAALIRPAVATTSRRRWAPRRRRRERAAAEQAQLQAIALVGRIRGPVPSPGLVAVASTKGGVGKTTTTLLLGNTLAAIRDDTPVAIDANPDAGSLARRINRTSTATAVDLLDLVGSLRDYYDLRHFTSITDSGLEVIAAADDPRDTRGVSAVDTDELLSRLQTWFPLVLADCGTGILTPSTRRIIDRSDTLVVVTSARVDAAQSVDQMLTALQSRGEQAAVERAVMVVNAVHPRSGVDATAVVEHFRQRVGAVVEVPWDAELSRGGVVDFGSLQPATRHAHAQVAAAVLDSLRQRARD